MSIKAMVVDAGGGEVRLILHRDTADYPQIGERVLLWTTDDCCRLDHCNCPPEFHDDWSATAQRDGSQEGRTDG